MASSTSTSVGDRGGLSRRAAKAQRSVKHQTSEELLAELFPARGPAFANVALDGATIHENLTKPGDGGAAQPQPHTLSANDGVADVAAWFQGSGQEGGRASAPPAVAPSAPGRVSIADAVLQATNGLAADAVMGGPAGNGPAPLRTGLPGDDYTDTLDQQDRPPNTYF